ncbi:MAG TPA: AmmeMemoRadiSam system protein A [Clostridiales bacterium]|jgi:AmmeMemoRadiSam system protein A|nr:AmmeMemoRadiSam system protein A [Clostridiales bacterium]
MNPICAIAVPHPQLIIPQVGKGDEKSIAATVEAYEKAADFVASFKPETIIIATPHSVMYSDYIHISTGIGASGSFARFRARDVSFKVRYDAELVTAIQGICMEEGISAGTEGERDPSLDHGVMVPLYFLRQAFGGNIDMPIVRIGLSGLALREHYKLGAAIKKAADKIGRKIAFVASGDLSHRLKEDGPYGYNEKGPEYDRKIMETLSKADFDALLDFSENLCDQAGECGHRAFVMMAGAFDGLSVKAEQLSYEGPFGVGYGVAIFEPIKEDESRNFLEAAGKQKRARIKSRRDNESEYVRLARASLESYVRDGKTIDIPKGLSDSLINRAAGAFVTIKKDGTLRGCIGTIYPVCPTLAQEIINNAVSSGTRDPRFNPVKPSELDELVYSVDVLGETEDINSPTELDVKRYGVIVSKGYRKGLLLPNLEGVDTVEEQISIARQKAGIAPDESVKLQRFEVVRHY